MSPFYHTWRDKAGVKNDFNKILVDFFWYDILKYIVWKIIIEDQPEEEYQILL